MIHLTLLTETFDGVPGGMNLALPAQSLDDTECRYLQDALVDVPGLTRRRGPVGKVTGIVNLARKGTGLVVTLNPLGIDKYGVLAGNASNGYFQVLSDDLTSVQTELAWPHPLPTDPSTPGASYRIVDAKPALFGGLMMGVSSAYDANTPNQGIAFWQGANRANYAGTISATRGSTAVTTASGFSANVVPGMWLFANTDDPYTAAFIGLVRSVNSDTSITLTAASPYTCTNKAATFQALRGFAPKVVTGRITCDTTSTTVTGGKTKFLSQKLNSGVWQLYRQSDMAFIGKVSSVATDLSLTLAANAAVACADERYIALRADADFNIVNTASVNKVGFLTATYADRQWYANNGAQFEKTSYCWFSDPTDPEAVDLSDFDGDWINVTSTSVVNEPIKALMPAQNGLVICKENETFIITGNSPASFAQRKLEDDGTLSGMSVQPYGGGVLWAGRTGIHFYDGVTVTNLIETKLGAYWKETMETFDPSKYRMWSMIERDHYFLFVENISPTIPVVKGNVSTTPTRYTFVVNLESKAVTLMTNLNLRGAITLPASSGKSTWFLVNGLDASTVPPSVNYGYTTIGGTASANGADSTRGAKVVVTEAGTLQQAQAYIQVNAGSGSQKHRVNVYDYNTNALVAQSADLTISGGDATGWKVFTFTPEILPAGTYWVLDQNDASTGTMSTSSRKDNIGVGTHYFHTDTFADGPADPLPANASGSPDATDSIYLSLAPARAFICDATAIFNEEGVDPITCDGGPVGPDFYFVSKKFNAGDSLRLKRFKQLALHYLVQGAAMNIDTVLGLNDVGTTLSTQFPASVYTWDTLRTSVSTWDNVKAQFSTWNSLIQGVFVPKRVRFIKRSQHLSFRVYQSSSSTSRLQIGPYQLGYKLQRPGRV